DPADSRRDGRIPRRSLVLPDHRVHAWYGRSGRRVPALGRPRAQPALREARAGRTAVLSWPRGDPILPNGDPDRIRAPARPLRADHVRAGLEPPARALERPAVHEPAYGLVR